MVVAHGKGARHFPLSLKSMDIMQSRVVHLQSSEEKHGFQFGDPTLPPYRIELDLFDRNDRKYRIWVSGNDPNHAFISQPELNALVASFKPVPHS